MKVVTRSMDRVLDVLLRKDTADASCTLECKRVNHNGQDCEKCRRPDCTITVICYPPPID
ncbi:hypothetical protein LX16_3746 [Stackebrandtia albiflava]|uniref:Uncharacterized protein n=1 Tax=Stackebrandtia albiflava TaxID=406432 RepID=A0A562V520_9ACTN|nr:hypothetical protein [Stackebrandtia albiflava]TWJ12979.1 hypothetical protein LX16_3746 [Stackebrandtia albiflava]